MPQGLSPTGPSELSAPFPRGVRIMLILGVVMDFAADAWKRLKVIEKKLDERKK